MALQVAIKLSWIVWGGYFIGGAGLVFGIFTALLPRQSIALYQWIMARINWRVSPIDEAHEIRTTRILGVFLTLTSLALLILFFLRLT